MMAMYLCRLFSPSRSAKYSAFSKDGVVRHCKDLLKVDSEIAGG